MGIGVVPHLQLMCFDVGIIAGVIFVGNATSLADVRACVVMRTLIASIIFLGVPLATATNSVQGWVVGERVGDRLPQTMMVFGLWRAVARGGRRR